MVSRRRTRFLLVLIPALCLLAACSTTSPVVPTETPISTASNSPVFMTLSPVPLMLRVNSALSPYAWVGPLTGAYIDALAPDAAVQIQYLRGTADKPMIANLFWFTTARYDELMASTDAPKGSEIGVQGDHVLFVQTALDMPFDPQSKHAKRFAALVDFVVEFPRYSMSDANLRLERP